MERALGKKRAPGRKAHVIFRHDMLPDLIFRDVWEVGLAFKFFLLVELDDIQDLIFHVRRDSPLVARYVIKLPDADIVRPALDQHSPEREGETFRQERDIAIDELVLEVQCFCRYDYRLPLVCRIESRRDEVGKRFPDPCPGLYYAYRVIYEAFGYEAGHLGLIFPGLELGESPRQYAVCCKVFFDLLDKGIFKHVPIINFSRTIEQPCVRKKFSRCR
ncbi:MAG: hypothetical protein M1269_03775 [Chloroflexi bacterium]|nr:hypothetical protein [Chloroflexota bacterium]